MFMRNILLFTVLIIGYNLPAFSQSNSRLQNNRLQFDSTVRNFSFNNNLKNFSSDKSNDFKWPLNNFFSDKSLLYTKFDDMNLIFRQDTIGIIKQPQSFDNMPCLKPQGFFPMPIYKPDSTVSYTLLIKKYQQVK